MLSVMSLVLYASETKLSIKMSVPEAPEVPILDSVKSKETKKITEVKKREEKKEKEKKRTTPLHDLVILINQGMQKSIAEPITAEFALTLCQKSFPIIVTGDLIKNIFELIELQKELMELKLIIDDFKKTFDEWLLYKTKDGEFYLFVPKAYIAKNESEIDTSIIEKNTKSKGYKTKNILFGFDIWGLDKVKLEDLQAIQWSSKSEVNIENLKSMFIQKKDEYFGMWNVYLGGHGTISTGGHESQLKGSSIAGLSLLQFQELIQFFNNKINVNFLYYMSCYAGGVNRTLPYLTNIMNSRGYITGIKKPNFTISVGSVSDIAGTVGNKAYQWCAACLNKKSVTECRAQKGNIDFVSFFDYLHKYSNTVGIRPTLFNDRELQRILGEVTYREKTEYDPYGISVLPQVMFPGTDIFTAVDLDGNIGILSNVLAKKHDIEKQPITFKNKDVILLYPQTISVPIIIKTDDKKPCSIISMVPGVALQKIESLEINTTTKLFFATFDVGGKNRATFYKYYYIHTLKLLDDEAKGHIVLSDVLVMLSPKVANSMYIFTLRNKIYKQILPNEEERADSIFALDKKIAEITTDSFVTSLFNYFFNNAYDYIYSNAFDYEFQLKNLLTHHQLKKLEELKANKKK